jgi:hypothetical protein
MRIIVDEKFGKNNAGRLALNPGFRALRLRVYSLRFRV